MVAHSRYSAGGDEDVVLPNKLHIDNEDELGRAETILYSDTNKHFFDLLNEKQLTISFTLLFDIHFYFLGTLYTWAGKLRAVDISKNGTLFCSSKYLDQVMKDFEKMFRKNIPFFSASKQIRLSF
ncbi:MAG: hypothetical protein AAB664_04305 [Patescibacteria group bacterium]